ncbi:MAG: hypothetical protein ACYTGW_00755 [Planctomycetota bacterium]|jgi:hypothetical protein
MQFPRLSQLSLLVAGVAVSATPLTAQTTILAGTSTRTVSITRPHLHNIATSSDGSLWTVVYSADGQPNTSDAALTQSTDGGKTWKGLWYYPTQNQAVIGAIYIGSDCHTLHTVWTDRLTGTFLNLHYQTFDTAAKKWIGSPTVIQNGASTITWYPHDIQVTPKGTLIVGASSGAGGGPGFTGQSTILFVKKLGAQSFSAPIKVNKSTSLIVDIGRAPSMHVEGEILHIIYRTKRSATAGLHWGFSYRGFDTETLKFLQASDVHIGPSDNVGVNGGLLKATALDQSGNLYCVYVSPNKLRMAYGPKGNTGTNAGWQDITITADTGLLGGNSPTTAYTHFGMATGPSDQVHVIYSKLSESFKNLYIQTFKLGKPMLPPPLNNERLLKGTTANNSFVFVNGDANVRKLSGPFVATSGSPASNTNGIAQFFDVGGNPARAVELGIACSGSTPLSPLLRAQTLPLIGKQFDLVWSNLPRSAKFWLAIDLQCLATPVDMAAMGAPNCFIYGSLLVPIGPLGPAPLPTFKLSTQLPNDSKLVGTKVILQSVVVSPGANALGLVTTNALGVFM